MAEQEMLPVDREALARLQRAADQREHSFQMDLVHAQRSCQEPPDLADATVSSIRLDDLQTVLRLAATKAADERVRG